MLPHFRIWDSSSSVCFPFLAENAREPGKFRFCYQKPEPKPPTLLPPATEPRPIRLPGILVCPRLCVSNSTQAPDPLQPLSTAEAAASPTPARLPSSSPSPSPWRPAPGSAPSTGEQHRNGTKRASGDTAPAASHDAHHRGAAASGTDAENSPGPRGIEERAAQRWVLCCDAPPFCGAVQAAYVSECHGDRSERKG